MKIFITHVLCILMLLSLCACGGNESAVKMKEVSSQRYSQREISDAIETIREEFDKEWKGCTLLEIYYAGDETSADYQDWADRNDADEVLVLLSSFSVAASGADGSLNPGSTYENWCWILVRDAGGKWKHVDHGY